jgi:glutamate/tyrosine decarboxylase-like PLP-dependent enzyme
MQIPKKGKNHQDVLDEMKGFGQADLDYKSGKSWSLVYYVDDEYYDFLKKAHHVYFSENGLNPMAFQSLKNLESEVVQMSASLLNGGDKNVGTMTSGGTESILMALKCYRDRARKKKPWILRPEVVLPATAHVAFDKAAHYFGLKLRKAPIDEEGQVNVKAMKKLINRNTILLVGSAPQYPHGSIDPIEEIAQLALKKKLPLHVDACFGGFILPWLEKNGVDLPKWDFRVNGVTSISADLHKYGYAAKGASVILYKDMSYLTHQFFITTEWSGGIYAGPTMAGTRPGGPIAAAWGALQAMGEDGYCHLARIAWESSEALRAGINQIEGLHLLGLPHSPIVTYASHDPDIDIYAVADQMSQQGWDVGRQQSPPSIHLTVNARNAPIVESYLTDLQSAVAIVKAQPSLKKEGEAAMYGMMAKVPVRGLVQHSVRKVMEGMYAVNGSAPDMAELGAGEDDGWILGLIHKYGDQAQTILEQVQDVKSTLSQWIGKKPL